MQPGQLDSLFTSIGQLLPQIISLSLTGDFEEGVLWGDSADQYPWPLLFSTANTTHTLTHRISAAQRSWTKHC